VSPILELRGVTKHFPLGRGRVLKAVDGVSLDVAEREVVGLVGESGCGKSTLGRTIVGLYPKTAGEIRYRGEALPARYRAEDFRRHARKIHMIFQDPYSSLDPRMRVGIARALALEPELVVCDEPISALDVSVQAQVVNLLADLKSSMGLTLVFIAHDLSMVRYVSDRIAVMYLGRLVELGPADDVYFRPRHPYTQALLAANPVADPAHERERPRPAVRGEIPSPIDLGVGCPFAGRCPHTMPACREFTPAWLEVAPGQRAACHLYDPAVAGPTAPPAASAGAGGAPAGET
jgi:oligopeptide/dipeptide ABC transporter ATP-binding protein